MDFGDYIGMKVLYRSASGKEWDAIITAIPEGAECGFSSKPCVSLIYKNERDKWMKKDRVLPEDGGFFTKVWVLTDSKYAWKDGRFVDD